MLMKIYTKTGDNGETGLFAGPRVGKDHPRIEAYGEVDELNSLLGVVRAEDVPKGIDELLQRLQNELFCIGAELATPDPQAKGTDLIGDFHIAELESAIDEQQAQLQPLQSFILPGGTRTAAMLHLARCVCRRAERSVVALSKAPDAAISARVVVYLNRLSDFLFVLARVVNQQAGQADVPWEKPPAESK